MITNIKITSSADQVQLDFTFQSEQQFTYSVQIIDDSGNESFNDQGAWDGKTSFILGKGADLVDKYLNIFWTVIDPIGAGNAFSAVANASQNGTKCPAAQTATGISSATAINLTTKAHLTT